MLLLLNEDKLSSNDLKVANNFSSTTSQLPRLTTKLNWSCLRNLSSTGIIPFQCRPPACFVKCAQCQWWRCNYSRLEGEHEYESLIHWGTESEVVGETETGDLTLHLNHLWTLNRQRERKIKNLGNNFLTLVNFIASFNENIAITRR